LKIPEIVRIICEQADTGSWYSPQHTLISLARTSRTFSVPALDVLWYEQRSLAPLVKCMPSTLWEERNIGDGVGIRRPIASADLTRLLFYSVRVRKLDLDDSFYGTVNSDFLVALDMALPVHGFMPKLSHFTWSPQKSPVLSIMRHFLGPQIRGINLDLGDDIAGLSILPFIKSSCRLVSELNLNVKLEIVSIRLVSDAICGWQHLTDLAVPNLDRVGFMHVSRLDSLTSLSLSFAKDTAFLHLPDFISRPTFPVLRSLFVTCETARFCTGILQVISSPKFEYLYIRPMACWTTVAWQKLHTAMHDYLSHDALDLIEVQELETPTRPVDITQYVISADALRPLLAFKKLDRVVYQVYPGFDIDDGFSEQMAQAWPDIVTLQFDNDVLITQRPRATLKSLISFARHCPSLSSLGVRLDASQVPEFTQIPGDRISHPLEELDVGTSPINGSREAHIAAFLSNIFPRLEHVLAFNTEHLWEPLDDERSWRRVSRMVPVFCAVREQEEDFYTADGIESEPGETGSIGSERRDDGVEAQTIELA
ncbi:hypothetical protein DFH06DRAFT_1399468, partial [Mycena polygramma]